MSRTLRYISIAVIAILTASLSTAAEKKNSRAAAWALAEKNYINALSSENEGARVSAAGFLGRYQLKGGIGPLITMLKTDKSERARRAAAFALIIMDDETGVKAVEESALYDGSEKVAAFCARLLELQTSRSYIAVSE